MLDITHTPHWRRFQHHFRPALSTERVALHFTARSISAKENAMANALSAMTRLGEAPPFDYLEFSSSLDKMFAFIFI